MSFKKKKKVNKSSRKHVYTYLFILILIIGLFLLFKVFGPNTGSLSQGEYLYIHTGSSYENVVHALKDGGFVRDIKSFDLLAERAKYPSRVKAGKYHIKKGMSNYAIIRMLRAGRQTPVKLVINKLRTKDDFIRFVSSNMEADSNVMRQMMNDPVYLSQFGLDTNTAMCAIMPDTYEFYWNASADKVFRKIEKTFAAYWTDARVKTAKNNGFTPQQIIALASIVDEETNNVGEKPNITSVYINRLSKGMKLQADPTAKFAAGDFTIKRVTNVHTSIPSPYNTYYVTGLPPGPICTPSKSSIQAALNPAKTNYIYFCAKGDGSGTHLFAANYEDHLKNAREYQKHLNEQGIH